jgi:hypothetical protein
MYIMKNTAFWNVTPCSPIDVHRRFEGIYCLYLQGKRVSQGKTSLKKASFASRAARFLTVSGFGYS